jgi:hypothetical protein
MKLNRVVVAFLAASTAIAATAATAGVASAAVTGHPKQTGKPKPKPAASAPQISGSRLADGLLPASAFGDGDYSTGQITTGKWLQSRPPTTSLARMSCATFEQFGFSDDIGDTASAQEDITSPDNFGDYPDVMIFGLQSVMQFASTKAAATYYGNLYAKFRACPTVTTPDPGSTDGGTTELSNISLTKTTIGHNQAFDVLQSDIDSDFLEFSFYNATTTVLAGTNVYMIYETNGTNDTIEPSLLSQLISRTQALYRKS